VVPEVEEAQEAVGVPVAVAAAALGVSTDLVMGAAVFSGLG